MINFPNPTTVAIPKLPSGWYALSFKILSGGRLAIVSTDVDVLAVLKSDHEQKLTRSARRFNANAKVWTFDGEKLFEGSAFALQSPFPIIDQFPDGRWLVSYARSDGKARTRVLDQTGAEIRRFELGDGIEHLKIDENGLIWVGWFDEGIFGNDNWNYPGHRWPPSSNGIAAFNSEGELIRKASIESIADCYALNVFDEEVWACTYTDFPIWQMIGKEENLWNSKLSGTKAIAISNPYVIAAGGYRDKLNRLVVLRLENDEVVTIGVWQIPQIRNENSEVLLLDGRADQLHLVSDENWYRWTVSQFRVKALH